MSHKDLRTPPAPTVPASPVEADELCCANCFWWRPPTTHLVPTQGSCRGAPPTAVFRNGGWSSVFPMTARDWYCGAFLHCAAVKVEAENAQREGARNSEGDSNG